MLMILFWYTLASSPLIRCKLLVMKEIATIVTQGSPVILTAKMKYKTTHDNSSKPVQYIAMLQNIWGMIGLNEVLQFLMLYPLKDWVIKEPLP